MSTPPIIWWSENYKKSSPMPEHSLIDGKTRPFKVSRNFSLILLSLLYFSTIYWFLSLADRCVAKNILFERFLWKIGRQGIQPNYKYLVAQEADTKIRSHRAEVQNLRLDNNELRHDLKELVEKNSDFARQVSESDRDRAQLNARVITLQQKLKPFLAKQ